LEREEPSALASKKSRPVVSKPSESQLKKIEEADSSAVTEATLAKSNKSLSTLPEARAQLRDDPNFDKSTLPTFSEALAEELSLDELSLAINSEADALPAEPELAAALEETDSTPSADYEDSVTLEEDETVSLPVVKSGAEALASLEAAAIAEATLEVQEAEGVVEAVPDPRYVQSSTTQLTPDSEPEVAKAIPSNAEQAIGEELFDGASEVEEEEVAPSPKEGEEVAVDEKEVSETEDHLVGLAAELAENVKSGEEIEGISSEQVGIAKAALGSVESVLHESGLRGGLGLIVAVLLLGSGLGMMFLSRRRRSR